MLFRAFALAGLCLLFLYPLAAQAQLSGHNTRGDYGLMSGTQVPVGTYGVGMYYDFAADTLRDRNGNSFPAISDGGSVDIRAAVAGLIKTTDRKLFGGNYGFGIYVAATNNAVELPALQTDTETSTGLADTYIQPLILGWTTKRADFMAGLGVYAPTGRYDPDADDNRGLGMWSYEAFAGTTVYFDEARTWHFAGTAFYETHGKKEDTDIRVGDILTIEGGFGKSFMDGAASAGLAYYAQWKVSRDDFGVTPPGGPFLGKHEVYGVGAELTLPLASKSKLYGFANLRYFWETGVKTTLEGETLLLTLSFPFPSIPLQ
ncbi:MAG: transporter [Gammaproteobacteria bacterium]|nr:transporter [Gammaproteobacteria bacterium]MDH3751392.1 transporter [Gammaproteobacteria bacterium]